MTQAIKSNLPLRAVAILVAGAGTLFWLYTFYAIAQVPVGDGSGFQWVAVMPLGLIFVVLAMPALVLALKNQGLWLSLALGCVGLITFALLWNELLSEFYH
jgi:xanthine/uracil permease